MATGYSVHQPQSDGHAAVDQTRREDAPRWQAGGLGHRVALDRDPLRRREVVRALRRPHLDAGRELVDDGARCAGHERRVAHQMPADGGEVGRRPDRQERDRTVDPGEEVLDDVEGVVARGEDRSAQDRLVQIRHRRAAVGEEDVVGVVRPAAEGPGDDLVRLPLVVDELAKDRVVDRRVREPAVLDGSLRGHSLMIAPLRPGCPGKRTSAEQRRRQAAPLVERGLGGLGR